MKKVAVLFANGTEEIEALTPVDIIRRAGATCDIVSICGNYPVGSHGITVKADKVIEDFDMSGYDAIVIPGGMPGATNIALSAGAVDAIKRAVKDKKLVCAICASPAVVLANHRLIDGKKVTCYPVIDFINALDQSTYTGTNVEVDENIITANGPRSAMEFSIEICNALSLTPKF